MWELSFCRQIHPLTFHTIIRAYTVLTKFNNYRIFLIRHRGYYSFTARFCAAIIRGWHLFLWKTQRHQQRLDKVHTGDTVTTVRHCQQYAQPLSPAVSHGIESYNTNNSSASLVTIISNYSHTYACVTYTSHSYYLRTAFILLSASNYAATIRGWRLFERSIYSKKYGILMCILLVCSFCDSKLKHIMYAHLVIGHTRWYRMVFSLWIYLALCASALVSKEARPPRM